MPHIDCGRVPERLKQSLEDEKFYDSETFYGRSCRTRPLRCQTAAERGESRAKFMRKQATEKNLSCKFGKRINFFGSSETHHGGIRNIFEGKWIMSLHFITVLASGGPSPGRQVIRKVADKTSQKNAMERHSKARL